MDGIVTAEGEKLAVRFIFPALRWAFDESARRNARTLALQPHFEWQSVLRLAGEERLSALLYGALWGQKFVPRRVQQALYDDYRYEVRRSLFLRHELGAVLGLLSGTGVEAILLKGAALVQVVYADWAARPMRDLDLLVHSEQLPAAAEALRCAGYSQDVEPRQGMALAYENEIAFSKPGVATDYLELHWSLFDSPYYQRRLPLSWFWETAVSAKQGDFSGMVLGPEAQILHLSGHLAFHHAREATLLWLHDVSMVIRHYKAVLDWDLLLDRAQDCNLVLPLQSVLKWVSEEMEAPVPAATLTRLRSLTASADETKVFSWHTAGERTIAQRIWSDLAHLPGWTQRLRYMWLKLFPSSDYMLTRYQVRHRGFLPVYYLYHLFVGVHSGIRLIVQG
jgi:hypothetical protein